MHWMGGCHGCCRCGNRFVLFFCFYLLLSVLCCRSLRGWWTCWIGWRPGTAPLAAPGMPNWKRWPRSVSASSPDTSNSSARRLASPKQFIHQPLALNITVFDTDVCVMGLSAESIWRRMWYLLKLLSKVRQNQVKKYQALYGFLLKRHSSHSSEGVLYMKGYLLSVLWLLFWLEVGWTKRS